MNDFAERLVLPGVDIAYGTTHEMGYDGEIGSLCSLDASGHLDDADVEVFLASAFDEYFWDEEPLTFGIEVEHLWRVTQPFEFLDGEEPEDGHAERWTYHYLTAERSGAIPVTRFLIDSPWSFPATSPEGPRLERNRRTHEFDVEGVDYFPMLCVNHPDRPATTGYPESSVIDPPLVIDGTVPMCGECSRSFSERLAEARRKALA